MIVSKYSRKREEAKTRLKALNVLHDAVVLWENEGEIYVSESTKTPDGERMPVLYFASQYPDMMAAIDEFEKKHRALVYHVIKTNMGFGLCWDFLFVSDDEEEWESDRKDLGGGEEFSYTPYVYCHNATVPFCSEFGVIGAEPKFGGILRIW